MIEGFYLPSSYNYTFVGLSLVVACLFCLTSLFVLQVATEKKGSYWWIVAGIVFGLGVWTTHFTGLVAYQLPIPVRYEHQTMVVSAFPSILGALFAFFLLSHGESTALKVSLSGLALGSGIIFMHYLGMKAIMLEAYAGYDPLMLIFIFVLTIAMTTFSLNLIQKKELLVGNERKLNVAKSAMGLAATTCLMHYMGLATVNYIVPTGFAVSEYAGTHLMEMDLASLVLRVDALIVGALLLVLLLIVAYYRKVKFNYEERNKDLDELVKERTEELTVAIKGNDEQMFRLAQINVRISLLHEAAKNLKQADNIYQKYGDELMFFTYIVRNISEATQSKYGAMLLLDDEGKVIDMVTPGVEEAIDKMIGKLPMTRGLLDFRNLGEGAVRYDNIFSETGFSGFPENHPVFSSLLIQPLRVESKLIGILMLGGKENDEVFTKDDEMTMEFYANEVSQILHKNKLMATLKRNNAALNKERKEQKALISKLQRAKEQLLQSEKMASIGQLAAGVAHEINNPVGYINSNIGSLDQYIQDLFMVLNLYEKCESYIDKNSELYGDLQDAKNRIDIEFLKEDVVSLLKESSEGVKRVKQIVQDLKEFSHVDETEWQWTDLHRNIDSVLNIVNNEIKYKAKVIKDYGDIPLVECFSSQIDQVFVNLLVNAAHAIEKKGVIKIKTRAKNGAVYVEITDTGKGIEKEKMGRIFDPFFTTKPVGQGTGLGLSLSYGIMQKHNGKISVQSEVGKGTKFVLKLPITQTARKLAS